MDDEDVIKVSRQVIAMTDHEIAVWMGAIVAVLEHRCGKVSTRVRLIGLIDKCLERLHGRT